MFNDIGGAVDGSFYEEVTDCVNETVYGEAENQ